MKKSLYFLYNIIYIIFSFREFVCIYIYRLNQYDIRLVKNFKLQ